MYQFKDTETWRIWPLHVKLNDFAAGEASHAIEYIINDYTDKLYEMFYGVQKHMINASREVLAQYADSKYDMKSYLTDFNFNQKVIR